MSYSQTFKYFRVLKYFLLISLTLSCSITTYNNDGPVDLPEHGQENEWNPFYSDQGLIGSPGKNEKSLFGYFRFRSSACKRWKKAAKEGHPGAQYELGLCYGEGKAFDLNLVKAYVWFSLSGEQGVRSGFENKEKIAQHLTQKQKIGAQKKLVKYRSKYLPKTPNL